MTPFSWCPKNLQNAEEAIVSAVHARNYTQLVCGLALSQVKRYGWYTRAGHASFADWVRVFVGQLPDLLQLKATRQLVLPFNGPEEAERLARAGAVVAYLFKAKHFGLMCEYQQTCSQGGISSDYVVV